MNYLIGTLGLACWWAAGVYVMRGTWPEAVLAAIAALLLTLAFIIGRKEETE